MLTHIFVSKWLHNMEIRRDVFQAISDPTRREILSLLAFQSLNLNAIAENFDVSRPAISQHIKILTECGLIVIRQQGRERYCNASLEPLAQVAEWIEPYRQFWAEKFDRLDSVLEEMMQEKSAQKKLSPKKASERKSSLTKSSPKKSSPKKPLRKKK